MGLNPNQLRLWFASMAYVLICALRRIGLAETTFADATCGTIRLKLLKIGALVRISVRRIKIAMASACPAAREWGHVARRLTSRQASRLAGLTRDAATRPIRGTTNKAHRRHLKSNRQPRLRRHGSSSPSQNPPITRRTAIGRVRNTG